ncbi:MAG: DUF1329 domain-containing protein [Burkholderiaceae bacterium]|nr:DUF1329 domain-containing protein [Burkholderiaceae bacterium]
MNSRFKNRVWVVFGLLFAGQQALAAVTAEEASQLNGSLTPYGAERVGNKDGTIPAWDGGYTKVSPGYKTGDSTGDLFADEKPKFSITAENMGQYADKLSEGAKGLLKKYPKTFRVDVYPTHRTAAAPQWVYDNIAKNATRAKVSADGTVIEGAYGGIPFPIPKSGVEVMWNHKLQYIGEANATQAPNYYGLADGTVVKGAEAINKIVFPYYFKDGSLETFKGEVAMMRVWVTGPAYKAGEQFLIIDSLNKPRQAWQYLPGQRRVRKAPSICCDAPEEVNSGIDFWDEVYGFWGDLDMYDWKLVGKKEIFIPYNNNKLISKGLTPDKIALSRHVNPDVMRWELHRVWVVEATLAKGKRHVVPKRTFYVDEDTWAAVLNEGYDAQGTLWRVGISSPFVVPEGPFVHGNGEWQIYNLIGGLYLAVVPDVSNPNYTWYFKTYGKEMTPLNYFTPSAMAAEGVR